MAGWTQGRSDGAIDGGEADEGDDEDREEEEDEEEAQSFFVRAVYDFTPADHSSLSFKQGDIIEVLTQLESGWWDGLIGGSVRGWFPSNYVEIVSEEEADDYFEQLLEKQEREQLEQQRYQSDVHQQRIAQHGHTQQQEQQQQRRPSAALSGAQPYDGLGLGQDFDALRSLMGAQDDDADATFEQLAEAAMRASDPTLASLHSPSSSSSSSTAPVTATRSSRATSSAATTNMTAHEGGRNRSSRISDLSWRNESYATTSTSASNASFANTEKSNAATPRSTAPSLVDGDKLQTGAEARLAGPSERERERLRAHSLSLGPPSHLAAPGSLSASTNLGRPRAATQASSRSRVAVRQTKDEQLNSFWVPKVNERGEVGHHLMKLELFPNIFGIVADVHLPSPFFFHLHHERLSISTREQAHKRKICQKGQTSRKIRPHRALHHPMTNRRGGFSNRQRPPQVLLGRPLSVIRRLCTSTMVPEAEARVSATV